MVHFDKILLFNKLFFSLAYKLYNTNEKLMLFYRDMHDSIKHKYYQQTQHYTDDCKTCLYTLDKMLYNNLFLNYLKSSNNNDIISFNFNNLRLTLYDRLFKMNDSELDIVIYYLKDLIDF